MKKLLAILIVGAIAIPATAASYSVPATGLVEDFNSMGLGSNAPGVTDPDTGDFDPYWDVIVETSWGNVQNLNTELQVSDWPAYGALNGGVDESDRGLGGLYIDNDSMQGRMVGYFQNDTGAEISELYVKFDYFMAWSRGDYGESVAFFVNDQNAGSDWAVTASDLGDYSNTTSYDPDDYAVTKSGFVTLDTPIAAGEDFTLTWNYQGQGGKKQAIGIDDLQVVPEPATMALLGLGGIAAIFRRRK